MKAATGMAKHLRVDREWHLGGLAEWKPMLVDLGCRLRLVTTPLRDDGTHRLVALTQRAKFNYRARLHTKFSQVSGGQHCTVSTHASAKRLHRWASCSRTVKFLG
jgi:hypothetical protein